ncbi:MAG: nitroreductase family deazaflavin-dependent oxidoreductase [Acidimicrobiales bacterium]|nr:nitroreductase family deazaflavin-dependent oxidoreductase [Acidimicrobiales bacterium]
MPTDQHVEMLWETPSHEDIVELTKAHVAAMESGSTDDAIWQQVGMHHVLLHTIGRKSGNEHKCALPTWRDPDGVRVVVGSFAGATSHPSWVWNMMDREANPRVRIKHQTGEYWSDHEILEGGDDRDRLWALLLEDRAWYADYQAKTDRTICLIRLPETEVIS